MSANRITLITLSVTDLPRARAYYEALGWICEEANDDVAFYDMGGMKFGLYVRAKLADDLGRDAAGLGAGAMTTTSSSTSTCRGRNTTSMGAWAGTATRWVRAP